MHIPQHVLDPATCAATGAISTAALGYACYRLQREEISAKLPLIALTGVSVLVAQSLNFPIASGTSGHLLGGALTGILLGPWAGMLVMAAVVAIQCFALNDGGVSALGANILNMAVIGSFVGHGVYAQVKSSLNGRHAVTAGAVAGAGCSIIASAIACSLELSLGGGFPTVPTFAAMLSLHSLIALPEMLLTGIVIAVAVDGVAKVNWQAAAIGLACAAVSLMTLSPFASRLPDGLQTVISAAPEDTFHH
jgi:cobalt/nickel transport system permease protein